MKRNSGECLRFLFIVPALLLALAAHAQTAPQAVIKGDMMYVTGGYGADEREAMEASKSEYNLILSNATKNGQFTANIALAISGKDGEILALNDVGPLLYVKLPKGAYTIKARSNGAELTRKAYVSDRKTVTVHLIWANNASPSKMDPAQSMDPLAPIIIEGKPPVKK